MTRHPVDSTVELPTLPSADALEAVPGYTLIRMLGESTLARAYECRAERAGGEIVVVKVLSKDFALDRAAVQRVLRENRVIAGLRLHPHVCRVFDVGEAAPGPYVAFERLKGMDLRTRLAQHGRMPVGDALAAVRDAARALEAAASVGVAHRDVKPSNLFLLDDGNVKLTDFGFAAPLSKLGGPDGVYGTPAFIAPELIRGAPADVRSDIYALGATLFQLVTARPLFEGATVDVLAAHQKKPVPSIATMVPDAGIAVVDILYRLLQKEPARRPQTASEVVKLLDDALTRMGRTAPTPSPAEPQWPTMRSSVELPLPHPPKPTSQRSRQEVAAPLPPKSPFDAVVETESETSNPYSAQPTGVMGTLKQMSVTEIIQMLEIGKKSGRIDVQDTAGLKGVVHIHDGQIVHCTAGAQVGEPAVLVLCQKKEGFFRIHYEKEPCERNVTRPTTFVLLEAMRQIDETSSNAPAPAPAPAAAAAPVAPAPTPRTPPPRPSSSSSSSSSPSAAAHKPGAPAGPAGAWPEPPSRRAESTHAGPPKPVSGFGRVPPVGDGIVRGDDDDELPMPAATLENRLDDVTLREGVATTQQQKPALDMAVDVWTKQIAPALLHAWEAAEQVVEPLRPRFARLHPKLADVSPLAVVAVAIGAVLAVIIGVASVAGGPGAGMGYDAALDKTLRGRAGDVVDDLAPLAPGARSLAQDLALADAFAATLNDDAALALYARVLPTGVVDPLALGFLLGRLDASAPDDEIDLLVLWPDYAVEELLEPMTWDLRTRVRQNAIAVLVERSALGRVNVEQAALCDLLPREGSCTSRRAALHALEAAGRSRAALDTVDRIGRAQDSCFQMSEISAAYKSIKKRL